MSSNQASKALQVRDCVFQLSVGEVQANIRFPCNFFFEWKTANGKNSVQSSKKVKGVKGLLDFDQKVQMKVLMFFDKETDRYKNRGAVIMLQLLSNSRPNDPKLVGRVSIDLGAIANSHQEMEFRTFKLDYCSVDATMSLKIIKISEQQSSTTIEQLDRSQLMQNDIGDPFKRQDSRSELMSSSSSAVRIGSSAKDINVGVSNEQNIKERLNRIKAEKKELINSKASSKVQYQREKEASKGSKEEEQPRIEVKYRSNDITMPMLAKDCSDFDSIRNSQHGLKFDSNEPKVPTRFSVPSSRQSKIKTHNHIDNNQQPESRQSVHSNLSLKDVNAGQKSSSIRVDQPNQHNDMQTVSAAVEKSQYKRLEERLKEVIQREENIKRELKESKEEIQSLNKSKAELDQLKELVQRYSKKIAELEEKNKQIQILRDETLQLKSISKQEQQHLEETIKAKQEYISELQMRLQQKIPTQSQQNVITSYGQRQNYEAEMEDLQHKLQTQIKNHENTKLQLEQLRDWFGQLQQKMKLQTAQKHQIQSELQALKIKNNQQNLQSFNEELHSLRQGLEQRQKENLMLMDQINRLNQDKVSLEQTVTNKEAEIEYIKGQRELQREEKGKQKDGVIEELRERIQELGKTLEEKQIALMEKQQDLQGQKNQYHQEKKEWKNRQNDAEGTKNRMDDLVNRLKQKEQTIASLQMQAQKHFSKASSHETETSQLRNQLKALESQRQKWHLSAQQLQHQLKKLKSQHSKSSQSTSSELNRIKFSYESEHSKRKELQRQKIQLQKQITKLQMEVVPELRSKAQFYVEREGALRQNLQIMEAQIARIGQVLQQRDQKEEQASNVIHTLSQQTFELNLHVGQLENQLNVMNERCQALQGEVQLLNAYMPQQEEGNENEMREMNRKLTEKNKQLLSMIQEKNMTITELEKCANQIKIQASKTQLSSSRLFRQKQDLEVKAQSLSEENQKLYKQFDRINMKFEEEMQAVERINSERMTELVREIEHLNEKVISKQMREKEVINEVKLAQEGLVRLEESLNQKNFQIQLYQTQLKELKQKKELMESKINVMHQEYETLYSELGQKEFQLYQAVNKVKQLQQKQETLDNNNQDSLRHSPQNNKSNLEAQLRVQVEEKEKEIKELTKRLSALDNKEDKNRQNIAQQYEKLKQEESSLRQTNQKQSKQLQNISKQKSELQKRVTELQKQRQSDSLFPNRESGISSTPICQFDESMGDVSKIQKIDFNNLVEQLQTILARRRQDDQIEGVLRLVIENNARGEDQIERWNTQRGTIQEKAKLVSKQIQKVKAQIMKNHKTPIAERSQLANMLKPAEAVINEIVNLSQTLSQMQIQAFQRQQAEEQQSLQKQT